MKGKHSDRASFDRILRSLAPIEPVPTSPGQLILEIGRSFLGTPYASGTLEAKGSETVIVNLREFDCVTFVETVVALAGCVQSRHKSFGSFCRLLRTIRYRQGRPEGYASRLHYFSDWIYDNRKKGILRDVTREIGGKPFRKTVHVMSGHPEQYPLLSRPETLEKMKRVERAISRRSLYFIPKTGFRRLEKRIQDGDILAITTNQEGLDILHTGFAVKKKGRVRLLHASRAAGKVVLSRDTLWRYVMKKRERSGIVVARIKPPVSGG